MAARLLLYIVLTTICRAATASPIDDCVLYSPSLVGHCALLHGGHKDPSFSTSPHTTVAFVTPVGGNEYKRAETVTPYTRGIERLNAGATKLAMADFTDAIAIKKDDAPSFAGRGWAKFSDRNFLGSIADYDQAIRLARNNPQLYLERGHVNIVLGRFENAIRDCTEAIRLDSNYDQAFNARGLAYAKEGNFARALQDYTSAIKLNPLVAIYYANRGYIYKAQKRTKDAIDDFVRALQFDPSLSEAANALSQVQPGRVVQTQTDQLVRKGKQVAENRCRDCHSIGKTDVSQENAPAFRTLSRRHEAQALRGPIERALAVTHDGMEVKLSSDEIEATVAYINSFVRR